MQQLSEVRTRRVIVAVAAALVALAALGVTPADWGAGPDAARAEPGHLHPVFAVNTEECGSYRAGTATVLETLGGPLVVTAEHVPDGATSLEVVDRDASLAVTASLAGFDLAVLEHPEWVTGLAAPTGPDVGPGDRVTVVGYGAGELTATDTRVEAVQLRSSQWGPAEVLVLAAAVEPGTSGGAVLDAEGRVVGIVVARDHRTDVAVAYRISDVLAAANLSRTPAPRC